MKEQTPNPTPEQMAMLIIAHLAALYDQIEAAAMAGKPHPAAIYQEQGAIVTANGKPNRIACVAVQVHPIVLRDAREALRKFRARQAATDSGCAAPQ